MAQANDSNFEIPDFLLEERKCEEILRTDAAKINFSSKFSLMCALRLKRMLLSLEGRRMYVRIQYLAAEILLLCHPDSSVLYNFFQDKADMIKDFIFLLSTFPDLSSNSQDLEQFIPGDIRILASKCLEAIIGSRDSTVSPIFIRYPWILHDLGVTRGQYMGLFPCLLRSTSQFMISAGSSELAVVDEAGMAEKLLWCEHVFILLLALVNSTAAMQALTENGLVPSILSILKNPSELEDDLPDKTAMRLPIFIYVEILATEVLESVVSNHPPAQTVFKELHGAEVALSRLSYEVSREVQQARTAENYHITNHNNIMIQELFSILQSFNQDSSHDPSSYADNRANGQMLYRNVDLNKSLHDIFTHPSLFTAAIISPAITLMQEIINSDPSPPTIQTHFVSSGLVNKALKIFDSLRDGGLDSDIVMAMLGLTSAVALTEEGLNLLKVVNPFQYIFEMFHRPEYVHPQSRTLNTDLPSMIGNSLEELIRHYPSLRSLCVDGLLSELDDIFSLLRGLPKNDEMDSEYLAILQFATAAISCLELLLQKKWTVTEFLSRGGFGILVKGLRLALGPSRFTIVSLACGVDTSFCPVGYFPLSSAVNRCLALLVDVEAKLVLNYLSDEIDNYVQDFNSSVASYWESTYSISFQTHKNILENIKAANIAPGKKVPYLRKLLKSLTEYVTIEEMNGIFEESEHASYSTSVGNESEVDVIAEQNLLNEVENLVYKTKSQLIDDNKSNSSQAAQSNTHLLGILNSLPRDSIQNIASEGPISVVLRRYAEVLKSLSVLGFVVESFGLALSPPRNGSKMDRACLETLDNDAFIAGIHNMVTKIFVPIIEELSKSPAPSIIDNILAHPVYHLLVIASDHIVVRDSYEDTAKKIGKIPRGVIVCASERKSTSSVNVKYRIEDGWISVYRNANLTEPQVQVLNVTAKTQAETKSEHELHKAILDTHRKKCEFELWSKISPLKSCIWSLQQFYLSVKVHVFSALPRHLLSYSSVPGMNSTPPMHVNRFALKILPTFLITMEKIADMILPSNDAVEFHSLKSVAQTLSDVNVTAKLSISKEHINEYLYVHSTKDCIPDMKLDSINAAIRIIEICNALIFETRRSKIEHINYVTLIHLSRYENMFEKVVKISTIIFLSCLDSGEAGSQTSTYSSAAAKERKEKRDICLCAVETVIEFWKQLYYLVTQAPTGSERYLQKEHAQYSNYDSVTFKRQILIVLSRYLAEVWSSKFIYTLPSSTIKNLLEVLYVAIKSLQDFKKLSSIKNFDQRDLPPNPIFGFGRAPSVSRGRSTFSFNCRVPSSAPAPVVSPPVPFVASDETLQRLQEMGFSRSSSTTAIRLLRTNDVGQLAEYLVDNRYLPLEVDPPTAAAAVATVPVTALASEPTANAENAMAQEIVASTESAIPESISVASASSGEGEGAPSSPASASASLLQIFATSIASNEQPSEFSSSSQAALESISNDEKSTDKESVGKLLPVLSITSEDEVQIDKQFVNSLPYCLYDFLPQLFVQLIEYGGVTTRVLSDAEVTLPVSKQQRDIHTMIILNQIFKCLDRFKEVSSNYMFALQLTWLYKRANQLLDADLLEDGHSKLFGVLHAILILLFSSSYKTSQVKSSHGHELIFLIFCLDSEYSSLHSKLINRLSEGRSTVFEASSNIDMDDDSVSWVSPALLILDFFAQPLLVDQQMLLSSIADFETYKRNDLLNNGNDGNYRKVLSTSVEATICEMYSLKRAAAETFRQPLFQVGSSAASDAAKVEEKKESSTITKPDPSAVQKVELPLFENGLKQEQKVELVSICGSILSLLNQRSLGKAKKYSIICHACLQLLVHLTRSKTERERFHSLDGVLTVLRCATYFEGLPKFVYSVVQQMLEDQGYLSLSMSTAIRLCLSKLSKSPDKMTKSSKVSFKVLIEAITPLLYRDQRLLLSILQDTTSFHRDRDGQVYVRYIEKEKSHSGRPKESSEGKQVRKRQRSASSIAVEESTAPSEVANDSVRPAVLVDKTQEKPKLKKPRVDSDSLLTPTVSTSEDIAADIQTLTSKSSEDLHLHASPLMQDVVEEIITQIVVKWIMITKIKQYLETDDKVALSKVLKELKKVPMSSMSIANLLVVLSDLVSSLPALAISILRFQLKKMKVLKILDCLESSPAKCLPLIHALTGNPLTSTAFTTFLVQSLLLPHIPFSKTKAKDKVVEIVSDGDSNSDDGDLRNIPDCDQIAGVDMKDSCCYLIAALASRQGIFNLFAICYASISCVL